MEKCFPYLSLQPVTKKDYPAMCKSRSSKIDKQVSVYNSAFDAAVGSSNTNISFDYQNPDKLLYANCTSYKEKQTESSKHNRENSTDVKLGNKICQDSGNVKTCSDTSWIQDAKHKKMKNEHKLHFKDSANFSVPNYSSFEKACKNNCKEEEFKATSTPLRERKKEKLINEERKKIELCSKAVQADTILLDDQENSVDPFDQMIIQTLDLYGKIFNARESYRKLSALSKTRRERTKVDKTNYCKNQGARVSKNNSLEKQGGKFSLAEKDNVVYGERKSGEKFCRCGNGCGTAVLNRCCCKKS